MMLQVNREAQEGGRALVSSEGGGGLLLPAWDVMSLPLGCLSGPLQNFIPVWAPMIPQLGCMRAQSLSRVQLFVTL